MVIFRFHMFVIISFLYLKEIKTVDNEEASQEYEVENSSLNSESYEAFNVSSKENRIDSEDTSHMDKEALQINHVSTFKSSCNQDSKTSQELNKTISTKFHVNYPFSVSIQRKSSHYASGALVHPQWVLTSAGDFYNVRESIKLFKARLGSVNCKRGGVTIPIRWVDIHPSYVPNNAAFDVALLKLATSVGYNEFVAAIPISKVSGRVVSAKFLVTYWPRIIMKDEVLPSSAKERFKQSTMRFSTQSLIPRDICDRIMQNNNITLGRSNLCLEPIVSHHSPCKPDPGAPVVAKDGLWGITSGWTPHRCTISSATVFTRLSSPRVQSWLNSVMVDI